MGRILKNVIDAAGNAMHKAGESASSQSQTGGKKKGKEITPEAETEEVDENAPIAGESTAARIAKYIKLR